MILANDEIKLVLEKEMPADLKRGFVPSFRFHILDKNDNIVGECDLRIGHNLNLFYGGNIGYKIFEEYRGNHYAGKACKLLFKLARENKLDYLFITCNPENIASRKTCEYLKGVFLETVDLPKDNDMYLKGERQKCIYFFNL